MNVEGVRAMGSIRSIYRSRLLGFLLLTGLLSGCMRYSKVELLGVRDAWITGMDNNGLTAMVEVEVSNPNNYVIQVMDPDVDLFVNGAPIGKAGMDSVLVLQPHSTQLYHIPLRASLNQAGGMLPLLLGQAFSGPMKLRAQGTVVGKAKSLRKRFPFELEHEITLR